MDNDTAKFYARKTELEQKLSYAIRRLKYEGDGSFAIPMTEGRWLALGSREYLRQIADKPVTGEPDGPREKAAAAAADDLLGFMRSAGMSMDVGEGQWLALGSTETLKHAGDDSNMKPYLGND